MRKEKEKFKYAKIALKEIEFKGVSKWQWLISSLLALIVAAITCYNTETVSILRVTTELLNDVLLAMLGMIFTGYALFQALLSEEMICEMKKYKGLLEDTNNSFLGLFLLYLIAIVLNLILVSVLEALPVDYSVFKNYWIDSTICFVLVLLYEVYIFRLLIELRNFVVNIYKIFIANNHLAVLKEAKKQEESTLYRMLQLQKMLDLKLITQEEYESKRQELLKKM